MKHTEGKGLEICPPASFEIGPVWHQGQEMRHKQGRRQLKCWRDNLWILNGGGKKNCFYFLNSLKKLFLLLRTVCVVRMKWNARGGKNDPWGSPNVNFGRQKTGFSFLKKCSWCLLQKKTSLPAKGRQNNASYGMLSYIHAIICYSNSAGLKCFARYNRVKNIQAEVLPSPNRNKNLWIWLAMSCFHQPPKQTLIPFMFEKLRCSALPHASPLAEVSRKNFWRWRDAESIN